MRPVTPHDSDGASPSYPSPGPGTRGRPSWRASLSARRRLRPARRIRQFDRDGCRTARFSRLAYGGTENLMRIQHSLCNLGIGFSLSHSKSEWRNGNLKKPPYLACRYNVGDLGNVNIGILSSAAAMNNRSGLPREREPSLSILCIASLTPAPTIPCNANRCGMFNTS